MSIKLYWHDLDNWVEKIKKRGVPLGYRFIVDTITDDKYDIQKPMEELIHLLLPDPNEEIYYNKTGIKITIYTFEELLTIYGDMLFDIKARVDARQ